jgi:hypothetical protein
MFRISVFIAVLALTGTAATRAIATTASKQIHPKTMLQFTNMCRGLHAVRNRQEL